MLKIRLSRYGRIKLNQYQIVLIDARKARDGKFIEKLGFYRPISNIKGEKTLIINLEKINFWVKRGCKITYTVNTLIKKFIKSNI